MFNLINTPRPRYIIGGGYSDLRGYHRGGDSLWQN